MAAQPGETPDVEGEPWVLRLGNFLTKKKDEPKDETPWAVKLGTYLEERRPAPWTIIANEKPKDPLALRLGTFLNELGGTHDGESSEPSEPIVLRVGNYLNGATRKGADGEDSPLMGGQSPTAAAPPQAVQAGRAY